MFRKDEQKDTRPTKKVGEYNGLQNKEEKEITSASGEKRIDFNICPFSPYGRFGTWFKINWRI